MGDLDSTYLQILSAGVQSDSEDKTVSLESELRTSRSWDTHKNLALIPEFIAI